MGSDHEESARSSRHREFRFRDAAPLARDQSLRSIPLCKNDRFQHPPTSKKLAKDREAQNRRIMTLRLRLVAFAMLAAPSAAMRMAPLAPRSVVRSRVVAQQRFSDPILDEKIPDPIYDEKTGYLGKSPIGFVQDAESFNGRAAMAGFTICFLQEIVLGKGECSLLRNQRSAHAAAAAMWSPGGGSGGAMVKWA